MLLSNTDIERFNDFVIKTSIREEVHAATKWGGVGTKIIPMFINNLHKISRSKKFICIRGVEIKNPDAP